MVQRGGDTPGVSLSPGGPSGRCSGSSGHCPCGRCCGARAWRTCSRGGAQGPGTPRRPPPRGPTASSTTCSRSTVRASCAGSSSRVGAGHGGGPGMWGGCSPITVTVCPPPLPAGNSRQGLRCKACKAGVHLWCSEGISHQQCPGKTVRAAGGHGPGSPPGTPRRGPGPGAAHTRVQEPPRAHGGPQQLPSSSPSTQDAQGCWVLLFPKIPFFFPQNLWVFFPQTPWIFFAKTPGLLGFFSPTPMFYPQATAFHRNLSSPLLLPEQGGSAQGEPPPGEPPAPAAPVVGAGWGGGGGP